MNHCHRFPMTDVVYDRIFVLKSAQVTSESENSEQYVCWNKTRKCNFHQNNLLWPKSMNVIYPNLNPKAELKLKKK